MLFDKIKNGINALKFKIFFRKTKRLYEKNLKTTLSGTSPENVTVFSDSQFSEEQELLTRNHYYSLLLESYVTQYRTNQDTKNKKKWQFYYLVIIAFVVVLLLLIAIPIVITYYYKENQTTVIVSYLTSFIGLFTSLIVIPQTIVKYLFNPHEDEVIANMVIEMQKQDLKTREINSAKEKNKYGRCNKPTRNKSDK